MGIGDWDWVFSDAWLSSSGLVERHGPPLWSVQISGGAPLRGDPQSLSFSPLLVFPLLLGPIVGVKFLVIVLLGVGLVGCQRLGERWLEDPFAACVFALGFTLSGYFAIHLRVGHFAWVAFGLVPWILLLADRVFADPAPGASGPAKLTAVAVLLFSGPVYQALVFFLLPALAVCWITRWRHEPIDRLRSVVGSLACAVLITMPRWIAIFDWQWRSPRDVPAHGGLPFLEILDMAVMRVDDYRQYVSWGHSGIWEYWCFTGWSAALLAVGALAFPSRLRTTALGSIALGIVLAWRSPWGSLVDALAEWLPLLLSVRVYSRFLVLGVFGTFLAASLTIAELRRRGGAIGMLATLGALALLAENGTVVLPVWGSIFGLDPRQVYAEEWNVPAIVPRYSQILTPPSVQRASATRENLNSRMLPLLEAGFVLRHGYSALVLPVADLPNGPVLGGPAPRDVRIRNDRIDLWGDFVPDETLTIRLRYLRHYNWRIVDRTKAELYKRDGDVAVHVLRPTDHVELRMRSTAEWIGWAGTLFGLALSTARIGRWRWSTARIPQAVPA